VALFDNYLADLVIMIVVSQVYFLPLFKLFIACYFNVPMGGCLLQLSCGYDKYLI
jgi:hypothetical protein